VDTFISSRHEEGKPAKLIPSLRVVRIVMKSFSIVALLLAVTTIASADTGALETESRTLDESSNDRALKMKMGKAFGGPKENHFGPKEARFDFKSMPKEHGGPKGKGWKEGPHAKGGKGHGPWEMEERSLKAGAGAKGGKGAKVSNYNHTH
jgi:hypothetical protein